MIEFLIFITCLLKVDFELYFMIPPDIVVIWIEIIGRCCLKTIEDATFHPFHLCLIVRCNSFNIVNVGIDQLRRLIDT